MWWLSFPSFCLEGRYWRGYGEVENEENTGDQVSPLHGFYNLHCPRLVRSEDGIVYPFPRSRMRISGIIRPFQPQCEKRANSHKDPQEYEDIVFHPLR